MLKDGVGSTPDYSWRDGGGAATTKNPTRIGPY